MRTKLVFCTFFYILITSIANAQHFAWAKSFGDISNNDAGSAVTTDINGNVYSVGNFHGTVDFDSGPGVNTLTAQSDVYVIKTDPAGNLIWVKQIVGSSTLWVTDIKVDLNGNLYMTGSFSDTARFNPSSSSSYLNTAGTLTYAAFACKWNTNGNYVWAKKINFGTSYGKALDVDNLGNVYITGSFNGNCDFDPNAGTNYISSSTWYEDIYIWKLTTNGNLAWAKALIGGGEDNAGNDIAVDKNYNVYLTGEFGDNVDFDPGIGTYTLTTAGWFSDIFVCKLSASGNFGWAKSIGNSGDEYGYGIAVDSLKHVIVVGEEQDILIRKLDSLGNTIWSKNLLGPWSGKPYAVALDKQGNIYTTGIFVGTIDFDPGPGIYNLYAWDTADVFISKLDAGGNFVWAKAFGSTGEDVARSIAVDSLENVYTTGYYEHNVDFDPGPNLYNLTSNGLREIFIQKLKTCLSYVTLNETACDAFNFDGQTLTASGIYYDTLINADGCDSIITLNLIVNNSTFSSLNVTACNNYFFNNQNLTASGVYYDTLSNVSGCDSIIALNLSVNNSTYSSLNITACNNYFFNNQTLTASGVYYDTLLNANGCDSLITLNLTINNSTTNTINLTECNNYFFNNQILTSSGTYFDTLTNASGCDSLIILNLVITTINTTTVQNLNTITANLGGANYQWLTCNPYGVISGATAQTYTAASNGDYAVAITHNGCMDTSECVTVVGIGVNEVAFNDQISILPNPTHSFINVYKTEGFNNATIKLISNTGQIVFEQKNVQGKQTQINLSNLAHGIFFVEIKEGEKVRRSKIVKN